MQTADKFDIVFRLFQHDTHDRQVNTRTGKRWSYTQSGRVVLVQQPRRHRSSPQKCSEALQDLTHIKTKNQKEPGKSIQQQKNLWVQSSGYLPRPAHALQQKSASTDHCCPLAWYLSVTCFRQLSGDQSRAVVLLPCGHEALRTKREAMVKTAVSSSKESQN